LGAPLPSGELRLFAAIDRASKFAFVRLVESAGKMEAAQFLRDLIEAVPDRERRLTKVNHPLGDLLIAVPAGTDRGLCPRWTNGQVERMNRTVKVYRPRLVGHRVEA
jgi:hypothetical protein